MAEPATNPEPDHALFMNLVVMFSTTAIQALGKLVNPATGKAETDLGSAQMAIDMLDMLKRRTRGNLADNESRALENTLSMLQMNYVETASQASASAPPEQPSEPSAGAPDATAERDTSIETPTDGAGPDSDPRRFHKSYGHV